MSKILRELNFKFKTFTRSLRPKKKLGYSKYSIVTACYNVEKYLDQYVSSLVNQSLSFKENIQLILVDDGSTDNTPNIAKKWANRFPSNIKYIRKYNGGVSSARNEGLAYVKNPWVSFCDPDDFLDIFAIKRVDDFLEKNEKKHLVCMVSMNLKFFIERNFKFKDDHPLKYRFYKNETLRKVCQLGDYIQLSANSVFFKSEKISKNALFFEEKCKPNFEDARFSNTYLLQCPDEEEVAFLRRAIYFYRKRNDKSSLIDKSWESEKQFSDVFEYGKIPLLKFAKKKRAEIPSFVQNTVIYDCGWHLRYLVNNEDKINFLSQDKKNRYLSLLKEVFSYCTSECILGFCRAPVNSDYYKVGMLGCFKNSEPLNYKIQIERVDYENRQIRLRYFYYYLHEEEIRINGEIVPPAFEKVVTDTIAGRTFVHHKVIWVSYSNYKEEALLSVSINNQSALLVLGREKDLCFSIKRIKAFYPRREVNEQSKYAKCWLISDRDTQADDNGEHFYKWLKNNHPEVKAYFLLRENSHDWSRLKEEHFDLIAYGSKEHRIALANCDAIISAHADDYTLDYFKERLPEWKKPKYIFLQHGIIQSDLSGWLNKQEISCFITTCKAEFDSIAGDNNRYRNLTKKEIKLTGLPRHDVLLNNNHPRKTILIMPTWRASLVGAQIGSSNNRAINPNFMNTKYAQTWGALLNSDELINIAKLYGYKIKFFPHANIQPYMDMFKIRCEIEKLTHADIRIQELFCEGSLLITDYSSVAFDFAYLKKPVIYYQFDYDDVYEKHSHIASKGYFDYEKNGFGSVVKEQTSLCKEIEKILNLDCKMSDKYKNRVDEFFAYRDGKCCERVYNEVTKLFYTMR